MKIYNKLVRDKIPEVLQNLGKKYSCHIADDEEFLLRLKDKMVEELQELYDDPCSEEMADVLEVLYTIAREMNLDIAEVYKAMSKKGKAKGRFRERIILEKVDT